MNNQGIMITDFQGMTLTSTGKVRDIYTLDSQLLIVATDRISIFVCGKITLSAPT